MRRWFYVLISAMVVLVFSFAPTHLLPAWSSSRGDVSVNASDPPTQYVFYMTLGSQAKGEIHVSGGNRDIDFYILDSGGTRVFDAGRIYGSYFFYWEVPRNDYYRFVFDNSRSWLTVKDVQWVFHLYYYMITFWVIGTILLVVSLIPLVRTLIPLVKAKLTKHES